jgi:hypothetical protein
MYFHSIIDSPACNTNVVRLDELSTDLGSVATTPNFVFITPNLCNDGHDGDGTGASGKGCVNGQPGGLASADGFLSTWVPKILASAAYQRDGLLIITLDEGNYSKVSSTNPSTGQAAVSLTFVGQHCCNQQIGPNVTRPYTNNLANTPTLVENIMYEGFGGDNVGAVLISPFVKHGSTSSTPYNHYSLLKSLEDIFQLEGHLGYAADNPANGYKLATIGDDASVFNAK